MSDPRSPAGVDADADVREDAETRLSRLEAREGELRESLIDAHDALLRRDVELEAATARAQELERMHREAAQRVNVLRQELAQAREALGARNAEALALRTRLDRILQSAPWRAYALLQRLPPLRAIQRRREAAYRAEVARRSADA